MVLAIWASLAGASASLAGENATATVEGAGAPSGTPQLALLDLFFPGFSVISSAVQKYTRIDLNLYLPAMIFFGAITFVWQYISDFVWGKLESYFMSTCLLRTDDEAYNYIMAWTAKQSFSQKCRRFIVNTNTNSRSWYTWRWHDDDEDEDDAYEGPEDKKKPLSYTPTFGSHYFFYKGHFMTFHRIQNREQASFLIASEREEISLSCFGRNPKVLKELLLEARDSYLKRDEKKTAIYRGTSRAGGGDPVWQRCMARTSRPFSTVILNEKTKKDLIDDVTDYLDPSTRRWYANRGIPYRRGYLLHGPPGTGKSSLSLALAGFFKMRIYIVSLSSIHASEENLSSLFNELPRRCVVLLEDIDTAGLTHTRDQPDDAAAANSSASSSASDDMVPGQLTPGAPTVIQPAGRLSLSGLLNILDGVASQEGRVLIMTTNHLEKLDKALIRPGRVDMIVNFGKADTGMVAALFRAIYAPLEGDDEPEKKLPDDKAALNPEAVAQRAVEIKAKREKAVERITALSDDFAAKVPAHEFSPAELQGFLMKNKRDPDAAVSGAEDWVVATRKEKKDKELKEAEDKRKQEEKEKKEAEEKKEKEKKEAEEKEKEEKKKEKEEAKRKKRKQKKKEESRKRASSRKSRKEARRGDDDGASSSDSSADDDSDSAASGDDDEPSPAAASKKKTTDSSKLAADPDAKAAAADAAAPADAPPAAPETTTTTITTAEESKKTEEAKKAVVVVVRPGEEDKDEAAEAAGEESGDAKAEGKTGMDSGYET